MVGVVAILFLTAVMVGIIAALGAGLLALIVVPVGLAAAAWLVLAARSRASSQEMLGPGGPDDPAR